MQIQSWEGAALSRAETVLQGTTHDTVRAEIGYGEKVSQRLWSKKVEEGIGLTARHRDAQRLEVPRVFELERAWKRDLSKGQRHTVLLDSDGNSARQLRIKAYWIFGRNHHRCASIPVVSGSIEQRCHMAREYVEKTNGVYAIAGSRVSLES
jgi:hypothetical protein